jgi:hypothetical protein
MTAEYGIAPAKPQTPIRATDVIPANIADGDIIAWLKAQLDGTHPEFPAPDPDTMYVLFYPPGTTITMSEDPMGGSPGRPSCQTWHGYHANFTVGKDTEVAFAVISRCPGIPEAPVTGIDYVSAVASHEIIEGLADPHPFDHPAFDTPDFDHIVWEVFTGGEIGDLCALEGNAFFKPSDFPYTVQRIWSNKAAAAGGDPCVPRIKAPYFQASFDPPDTVMVTANGYTMKSKGFTVPVGQSKTIDVDLFSDGPTGEWTVYAAQPKNFAPTLSLSLDKKGGQNGDKLTLTITAKAVDPTYGASPFALVSTLGGVRHYWYGLVGH